MTIVSTSYMIREFRSSKDKDFLRAISIYSKHIHPGLKTNTNEITYWLDHYNDEYSNVNGDKFYVIGFYYEDILIGYSEFVFLKSERLIIFDYLVIDALYRKNAVFFQFVKHLKKYIEKEGLNFDYAISEIGHLSEDVEPSRESQLLIRLFKMADGGILKAPYYQPQLGLENYESRMRGVLLVFSYSQLNEISRETFLSIVHSIYYKHYVRWYSIYDETAKIYSTEVDKLFDKLTRETDKMKYIKINGYKYSFEDSPSTPEHQKTNIPSFVVLSLVFIVFLTFIMLEVQRIYQISLFSFITIYCLALISYFAVMAIFSDNAFKVFTKLLQLFKIFSRKLK